MVLPHIIGKAIEGFYPGADNLELSPRSPVDPNTASVDNRVSLLAMRP